ncbi:MAG: sulfite exporter TauE/SafE family protein [Marinilabiliales bacterium]
MEYSWYLIIGVIAVGFFAGFINTLAGSGSLLTLPLLMFLGLDANVANGTNRIAILLQNIVGVSSFKQQKVFEWKQGLWFAIPAIVGSLIGARIAINLNNHVMKITIACLLIVMFFLILFKPDSWIKGKDKKVSAKPGFLQILIFFLIGVYGGFIQAGVGFFLLAGLVLGAGLDIVKANAIKVLIILFYTPIALSVFIWYNQIDYKIGLILAVGNMIGAFVGSRVAVSWGPKFVRIILLITLCIAALQLLGVVEYIFSFIDKIF